MKNPKILNLNQILELAKTKSKQGQRIVLCHGHFNVIHPGHLRFLHFAKKQGDLLIVSVLRDEDLDPKNKSHYFSQIERAEGPAAIETVDAVYGLDEKVEDFILQLKPDVYVKGHEFESRREEIKAELRAIESCGGKVIFGSGEVSYAPSGFSKKNLNEKKKVFLRACQKHDISLEKISNAVDHFSKLKMLVIGDTIVDQFVSCDALGVSSEAPVMAIRELESKEFIGGAAIIAQHLRSLGADCRFISVIGEDDSGRFVQKALRESGVKAELATDETRPTTFKIRYMVDNQKLLRVSRLKQHDVSSKIEDKIIEQLEKCTDQCDGLIISDFVYGVITPRVLEAILEIAKKKKIKVFGDLQCSSQVGDVTKFTSIDLITPTEKEARIGLSDQTSGIEVLAQNLIEKTKNKNVVLTLGSQGLLAYSGEGNLSAKNLSVYSEYFPAMEDNAVDVAGAGDSVLTGYALGLCYGLNLMEASALATCMAGISVMRIGNIPLKTEEVKDYVQELIEQHQFSEH